MHSFWAITNLSFLLYKSVNLLKLAVEWFDVIYTSFYKVWNVKSNVIPSHGKVSWHNIPYIHANIYLVGVLVPTRQIWKVYELCLLCQWGGNSQLDFFRRECSIKPIYFYISNSLRSGLQQGKRRDCRVFDSEVKEEL